MTMVFAGPQADDKTKLHAVIRFKSMEHLQKFQADEELTQKRIEAGVKAQTEPFTIVSDESLMNYPMTISQHE